MPAKLSLHQARRIALAAQGLDKVRPAGPVTARAVGRTFARLQLVQIDSVNVLARSHFLPFFSRLGPYDRSILQRMASSHPRRMMEYWAHEASFIRPGHYRDLLLWQKREWVGAGRLDPDVRDAVARRVLDILERSRPLTASELTVRMGHVEPEQAGGWGWNWNTVKRVLEHLFEAGVVGAASRTEQFERRYTLAERILPVPDGGPSDPAAQDARAEALHRLGILPVPDGGPSDPAAQDARADALHRLVEAAARAHGIGTVRCFADYFRTPLKATADSVDHLVAAGVLEPVTVDGWNRTVFRHGEARLPRRADGRALLSPFDSAVFERRRLEELFGFHYRIEIYTPRPKRRFGYYVLPFLLRDAMVARVDLKADRQGGRLLVRSAFAEPEAPADTAVELAAELALMAGWLGLDGVEVYPVGDLAGALSGAVGKA